MTYAVTVEHLKERIEDLDEILDAPTEWHYVLPDEHPYWVAWEERETANKMGRVSMMMGIAGGDV